MDKHLEQVSRRVAAMPHWQRDSLGQFDDGYDEIDRLDCVIEQWSETGDDIKRRIASMGQSLVIELSQRIGLRELGRRASLSPTYLCQIKHGNVVISPESYMQLCRLRRKLK